MQHVVWLASKVLGQEVGGWWLEPVRGKILSDHSRGGGPQDSLGGDGLGGPVATEFCCWDSWVMDD